MTYQQTKLLQEAEELEQIFRRDHIGYTGSIVDDVIDILQIKKPPKTPRRKKGDGGLKYLYD